MGYYLLKGVWFVRGGGGWWGSDADVWVIILFQDYFRDRF